MSSAGQVPITRFFPKDTLPMIRFRNFLPLMAALLGATILGAPTEARADFAVFVYDDGVLAGSSVYNSTTMTTTNSGTIVGIQTSPTGNSLLFGGSTTHFSITNGSGLSNNPGTQTQSNLDL